MQSDTPQGDWPAEEVEIPTEPPVMRVRGLAPEEIPPEVPQSSPARIGSPSPAPTEPQPTNREPAGTDAGGGRAPHERHADRTRPPDRGDPLGSTSGRGDTERSEVSPEVAEAFPVGLGDADEGEISASPAAAAARAPDHGPGSGVFDHRPLVGPDHQDLPARTDRPRTVLDGVGRAGPAVESHEPFDTIAEEPVVRSRLPLPRVIAVANQKGGVGKTTTTVNVAACLAELGHRTLLVDLDPQANASTGLGLDPRALEHSIYHVMLHNVAADSCIEPTEVKNLFILPSSLDLAGAEIELVPAMSREHRLRVAIESVIEDYDYVLIDCPPSLGLLTINALTAAKEILVPIQCEYYALEGLGQLLHNVELVTTNLNPKLQISHIVLVMFDSRTKLAGQVVDEVREHFGALVCDNVIPRTVRLSEAPSFGQPITTFDPTSTGAEAYRAVTKEVVGG